MGIYNLNPRRVVWFSPNEPSNKYDIWLSRNAHLDENGEPTTDSNSQRDCDYIFKIYDCGKWNPIVGFNSTAANKIDTVTGADYTIDGITHSGKEVYHPAIFTAESPNELYDAGTLGELLKDTHFVTEEDWEDIYNEYIKTVIEQYPFDLWPARQNELGGIFADRFANDHSSQLSSANKPWIAQCKYKYNDLNNYNLYVHAKDIISIINNYQEDNPSTPTLNIPWATTERCGGILSDTHTYDAVSAFKPIEVKFYPTTNAYSSKLHRLCVSASDVIQLINNYYNDNPSGQALTIPLATYEKIGGARILTDTTTLDYRGVPVLFGGPNAGLTYGSNTPEGLVLYGDSATYNPDNSFLYVPAWAIMDIISNPTGEQTPEPMIRNGFGTFAQWNIDSRTGLNYCTISLQCTPSLDKGKYLRINSAGTDIEWVDVQSGESYISGTGIDIQNNEISIDMTGAETDNVLVATSSSSVGWAAITHPTYTSTNAQIITFTGNDDSGYVFHLKPNCRYYCTSQILAITLYSYSTPIFIPSIIEFVTSDKPLLRFDSSYDFIETYTTNSTSYSLSFSYDSTYNLYTIALKPETKYIVTINGNKISVDEISDKDTLFNVQ